MPPKKKTISTKAAPEQPVPIVATTTPKEVLSASQVPATGKPMNRSMLIVILVVLIVLGFGGGYYAYTLLRPKTATNPTVNTVGTVNYPVVNADGTVNYGDNTNTPDVNYSATDVNAPGVAIGAVSWQDRKEIASLGLISTTLQYSETSEQNANYYQVGTVKTGALAGAKVILLTVSYNSPQGPDQYYFLQNGTTLTAIAKNSSVIAADPTQDTLNRTKFTVDVVDELPGIRFPETLTGPKPRQTLVQVANVHEFFPTDGLTKIFTDAQLGPVYTKANIANANDNSNNAVLGGDNSSGGAFYIKAPDGTLRIYFLMPDIIPAQTDHQYGLASAVPSITWSNGVINADAYSLTTLGGCGSSNYLNVIDPSKINRSTDLRQVGTTAKGDAVYEMKDSNAQLLKDYYDTTYFVGEGMGVTKATYTEFIAHHPLVFWVDPFDRLVQMSNMKYAPQAECGKPVIYLYPQTTTNVDVQLQPRGGFTYTEPAYNGGWQVTAQPSGQLTERSTGRTYPYLFWEGRGGIYAPPTKGFVVAQADVHTFLVAKLAALGLNEKETADFIAFWEPRMQGHPYYAVSFLGNATMDTLAPLTVTPRPDTIIRVLMDYKPLSAPVAMNPQIIRTPQRNGFTVVEWGGVLR